MGNTQTLKKYIVDKEILLCIFLDIIFREWRNKGPKFLVGIKAISRDEDFLWVTYIIWGSFQLCVIENYTDSSLTKAIIGSPEWQGLQWRDQDPYFSCIL